MDRQGHKICLFGRKISEFSKESIEDYNQNGDEGYFFETDFQYLEKLCHLHNDFPFCLKEWI